MKTIGGTCLQALCAAVSFIQMIWAVAILVFAGLLQSDWHPLHYIPATLDIVLLWTYGLLLLILGITMYYSVLSKNPTRLSWQVLAFSVLQTIVFIILIVLMYLGGFEFDEPTWWDEVDISPYEMAACIIGGVHCAGTLTYTMLIVLYVYCLECHETN